MHHEVKALVAKSADKTYDIKGVLKQDLTILEIFEEWLGDASVIKCRLVDRKFIRISIATGSRVISIAVGSGMVL